MYRTCANAFLLSTFFLIWIVINVRDLGFPLIDVNDDSVHSAIGSDLVCPFVLTSEDRWLGRPVEELIVEGGSGYILFYKERFLEVLLMAGDLDSVHSWLSSQLSVYHLYDEVLSSNKLWIALFCVTILNLSVFIIIFDPFLPSTEKESASIEEFRKVETSRIESTLRQFVSEKLIVISFVIIRSRRALFREQSLPSGVLPLAGLVTDATVFSIWYIVVGSISIMTTTANHRFEAMNKLVGGDLATQRTMLRRIAAVLLACVGTSVSMVSLAGCAFEIIHPLYSCIMFCDSIRILVRSVYVFKRVMDLGTYPSGNTSRAGFKLITDVSSDALMAVVYGLYLVVGTLLHKKLLPLCFVAPLTYHCSKLTSHLVRWYQGKPISELLR